MNLNIKWDNNNKNKKSCIKYKAKHSKKKNSFDQLINNKQQILHSDKQTKTFNIQTYINENMKRDGIWNETQIDRLIDST